MLATLTRLTARTVADAAHRHGVTEVIASGGGVRNPTLMAALAEELAPRSCSTSDALGLPAQAKEAYAFAVLGFLTHQGRDGTLASAPAPATRACSAPSHRGRFAARSPGTASRMIWKIGFSALACACLTTATAQADSFRTVPTTGLT